MPETIDAPQALDQDPQAMPEPADEHLTHRIPGLENFKFSDEDLARELQADAEPAAQPLTFEQLSIEDQPEYETSSPQDTFLESLKNSDSGLESDDVVPDSDGSSVSAVPEATAPVAPDVAIQNSPDADATEEEPAVDTEPAVEDEPDTGLAQPTNEDFPKVEAISASEITPDTLTNNAAATIGITPENFEQAASSIAIQLPEQAADAPTAPAEQIDDTPVTEKTVTDRLKHMFQVVKDSPQYAYSKLQASFSADPEKYDARRARRGAIMNYMVGAAVVAKTVASGYMAAKGLGANFANSEILNNLAEQAGEWKDQIGEWTDGAEDFVDEAGRRIEYAGDYVKAFGSSIGDEFADRPSGFDEGFGLGVELSPEAPEDIPQPDTQTAQEVTEPDAMSDAEKQANFEMAKGELREIAVTNAAAVGVLNAHLAAEHVVRSKLERDEATTETTDENRDNQAEPVADEPKSKTDLKAEKKKQQKLDAAQVALAALRKKSGKRVRQ